MQHLFIYSEQPENTIPDDSTYQSYYIAKAVFYFLHFSDYLSYLRQKTIITAKAILQE